MDKYSREKNGILPAKINENLFPKGKKYKQNHQIQKYTGIWHF